MAVAEALYAEGIRVVEAPLNSPDPLESIRRLGEAMGERIVHGAGTVLTAEAVRQVAQARGRIIVSPDTRPDVIRAAIEAGLTPLPGFATASEAFQAYEAGARRLKLFPAGAYGPALLKALSEVLPKDASIMPVGGVGPAQMADWWAAGARGFGVGGDLYKAGFTPAQVGERARAVVAAVRALRG